MFIYQLQRSLYSCKLRIAMALKGVTIERREPPSGGYRGPEYRAIVPAASIPALVDGDLTLTESDAIIEYLDETCRGPSLLPGPPARRARARMISRHHDLRLEPLVRGLFPIALQRDAMRDVGPAIRPKFEAALTLIDGELDSVGPFAVGAEPTLADCGLPVTVVWIAALAPRLGVDVIAPARVTRVHDALRTHASVRDELREYERLVADWLNPTG